MSVSDQIRHVRATVSPQRSLLLNVATKTFFPWRNSPNTGFLSRKAIFQSIDDSLMRLGMDYVDLFQIHRFDYSTPVEETMEALHDLVKAGKARYIGASSMEAWRFAKMQHTAERNGWTRFITMQPQYNLLYREEEREMLPLCEDQGVGVIPWSPMARGRLTRDWSVTSRRTQNDAFALKMYDFLGQPRALLDIGRLFGAIHVCCINEIDTRLKRLIQNAGAGFLVGDVTKIHGSEAKAADFQAGAAKMRIVHKRLR